MNYNQLKIRSKRWPQGHLKVDYYVSTQLAAEIIKLIAANEKTGHAISKLPVERDKNGRFKAVKVKAVTK